MGAPARSLTIRVLGPVEVLDPAGAPVPLPGNRERQVLGVLAVRCGTVVPADELIELIWGDDLPQNPANALQARVSSLRRVLGHDRIETAKPGYRLVASRDEVDLTALEDLLDEASGVAAADPTTAEALSARALRLWRGTPLVDLDHPSLAPVAGRAAELRRRAVVLRAWALIALGRADEAIPMLTESISEEPLDESVAHAALVALGRAGRQVDGLRLAQQHRQALADAGLEPGPAIVEAERSLFVDRPTNEPGRVPPPFYGDPFVGRVAERDAVAAAVQGQRLTTITGSGGIGKSRLAREVALEAATWWCDLAGASTDLDVASVICSALRIRPDQGARAEDALRDALADRTALLILDGCEHVASGVAALVSSLLAHSDQLHVFATSRTALGVPGEHVISLGPLPLTGQGSASELFRERASAHAALDRDDDESVEAIAAELDGMPLALELAASRLAVMAPGELLTHLAGQLHQFSADERTRPERHRSIEASVHTSLAQLTDLQRSALMAVAAFRGPFGVTDAAWMIDADPGTAASVIDVLRRESLLQPIRSRPPTFRVLAPIREVVWALGNGGQAAQLARRHTSWVASELEKTREAHRGRHEHAAVERLDALRPEVAAVVARTHAGAQEVLAPLAELQAFRLSLDDASVFVDAVTTTDGRLDPWVLAAAAQSAFIAGDLDRAGVLVERARDESREGRLPWLATWIEGARALFTGSFGEARVLFEESGDHADDPWERAFFGATAAHAAAYGGDVDATEAARAAIRASQMVGSPSCQAWAAAALALSLYESDPESAGAALADAEGLARSVANQVVLEVVHQRRLELDPGGQTARSLLDSLDVWQSRGNRAHAAELIARTLPAFAAHGAHETVATLDGAIRGAPGADLRLPGDQRRIESALQGSRDRLGGVRYRELQEHGRALRFDEAVELTQRELRQLLQHG